MNNPLKKYTHKLHAKLRSYKEHWDNLHKKLMSYEQYWEIRKIIKAPYYWVHHKIDQTQRLIYWIPIILKSGDWDFHEALYFFMLKLRKVRKTIDTNRRHVGDEHRVRRMWETEQVLRRLLGEAGPDYEMQIYKEGDDFGGEITFGEPDENGLKRLYIGKINKKECCLVKDNIKHSEMLRKQDIDFLATHLKKYSMGWWD